jgi:hypothetical protein
MKFELGHLVITSAAAEWLEERAGRADAVNSCIGRHADGDWGGVSDDDFKANDDAVASGDRLLSSYGVDGATLWIITEADRSATTVLFPEDY